jgi:hypothetical protein
MLSARVTGITMSDGTRVDVPEQGLLLLVGPNNAGKSQVLRDILESSRDQNHRGRAVVTLDLDKQTGNEPEAWVRANVPSMPRHPDRFHVEGWGEVSIENVLTQWGQPRLNVLTNLFILHADGRSRLTAGDSQNSIDFSTQAPSHPVQVAYRSPTIEAALNDEGKKAFDLEVTVDRYAGSRISLRLGPRPAFEHVQGRPLDSYLTALNALPRLEDQGDGVRSYLGLLLHLAAGTHQVLLVDEPEAFLHPPQARLLGGVLARQATDKQAFVATHSTDVVQGVLEGDSAVTIVRITRRGDVNHAAVLSDTAVKELWSDPLLRYSNVLDGLFHDVVVLCESDADCRYYAAVLDQLSRAPTVADASQSRGPQILFTHCGGKARLASVVSALSAVSVPVAVVADFDFLREPADVERLVEALGGNFDSLSADLQALAAALESDVKPLRRIALKDELDRRLDEMESATVGPKDAEALRGIIKAESGWDKAKRSGQAAVPQGQASEACSRLLAALAEIGLLVVPVGELERFVPAVGGHGPAWVTGVLEQQLHQNPDRDAEQFVRSIRDTASSLAQTA